MRAIQIIGLIGLAGTLITGYNNKQTTEPTCPDHTQYQDTIAQLIWERNYYQHWADTLQYTQDSILVPELEGWMDHATRMRWILGIPEDQELSYQTKCQYSIETTRLVGSKAIR